MNNNNNETQPILEDYIGDGVYVEFTGYSIILKANDHKRPTDVIHLEESVLKALNRFAEQHDFAKNDRTSHV